MYLPDFLEAIFSKDELTEHFPLSLELPYRMTVKFKILLQQGRKEKKELGYSLRYNNVTKTITYSHLCQGSSHGITLPVDNSEFGFGNVHCHPALRYKGGHPAHSPEDVQAFKANSSKPIFIAFVASGEDYTNYALVFRHGVSTFKQDIVSRIQKETIAKLLNYFNTHCPLNAETRDRMRIDIMSARTPQSYALERRKAQFKNSQLLPRVTVKSSEEKSEMIEELETGLNRITPGFGRCSETLSIDNMQTLVKECKFAFYRSVRGKPGRLIRYQW